MPKEHKVKYDVGKTYMTDTPGPFTIIDNKSLSETKRLWIQLGKSSIPHDQGYQIRLKCGHEHWTLTRQIKKCIDPNPSDPPAHGWKDCYNCDGIFNINTCPVVKKNHHQIKKVPERNTELISGTLYNEMCVIGYAFKAKCHNYWEFECTKCGNHIFRMTPTNQNDIENCHCPFCNSKYSKGERKIKEFLDDNLIQYDTQYKFEDCKHINSLPFDFVIFDFNNKIKCLIEYDGEQHYNFIKLFHGDEEGFKYQQLRDRIKTDYCKDHNIKLIRIPYTDYNNINQILTNYLL